MFRFAGWSNLEIWFYFFLIVIIAAILRLLPHFISRHGTGVDHWYWKLYIETYRKTGSFPPVLDQFLLDLHQWYPPLFPLVIAKLPNFLYNRYSHLLAAGIDLARLGLVMVAAYAFTGHLTALIAAGLVYAFTPILISYNVQLNPRGLGALFLDTIVLLLIWLIWHNGALWGWALVVLISGLLLLTHKMTTQLFWFSCIFSGLLLSDWRLVILAPLSIISALILSRGFYFNILRGHWDIVSFWNRNWRWLSAHQILESPIYGSPGYETPTKYYHSGIHGFIRRMQHLLGFNPWGWTILGVSLWMYWNDPMHIYLRMEDAWLIKWLSVILIFILLTTFVPCLRCLGNGYLYNYNVTFPASILVAHVWEALISSGGELHHSIVVEYILYGTFLTCLVGISFYFGVLKNSKTLKVDSDIDFAIKHLKQLPDGVVMCFPAHWHDLIAYKTNKKVLSGGHGFGFKLSEPIWPRLLIPISEVIEKYKVKFILSYEGYLPDNFIKELPLDSSVSFGTYRLHCLK